MNKNEAIAWLFWFAGIYLIARAIHTWQDVYFEAGKAQGYVDAFKELDEISEQKAIARRLAAEANAENERTPKT